MNQWKNEKEAIDWFKSVNQKQLGKFVIFDIYLSIYLSI